MLPQLFHVHYTLWPPHDVLGEQAVSRYAQSASALLRDIEFTLAKQGQCVRHIKIKSEGH